MVKKLLIDAIHLEEVRVVVIDDNVLLDFESETSLKKQIKGNIYVARVVRVEPALQAAFVDFGGNRHGFLAFSEIHPDFYLRDENFKGKVKIQDVVKKKQMVIVQAIKEERGNKGAAFSTYISLAGRYCVLMPYSQSKGVSRKIVDEDRKRLQDIIKSIDIPESYGVILRTASQEKTKIEIKRDLSYLLKLWNEIKEKSKNINTPTIVFEEVNLIKKAIRDIYSKDIEEIVIDGEEAYKEAKTLMRTLSPSHLKKVRQYKEKTIPLFQAYDVEEQIYKISEPSINLRSGGNIVIAQTEALVAIDVNSAKSIREKSINETAIKTNLEAADEIARQIRLRDLAGLIVIDFIDMYDQYHVSLVEKRFKEATKRDRARIQIGKISNFGLLELSRQRLRPSFQEAHTLMCPHCLGSGFLRSIESTALYILRQLELEVYQHPKWKEIIVYVPEEADLYLLNHKRSSIFSLEKKFNINIQILRDRSLLLPQYKIQTILEEEDEIIAHHDVADVQDVKVELKPIMQNDASLEQKTDKKPKRRNSRRRKIKEEQLLENKKDFKIDKIEEIDLKNEDDIQIEAKDLPSVLDIKLIPNKPKRIYRKKTYDRSTTNST